MDSTNKNQDSDSEPNPFEVVDLNEESQPKTPKSYQYQPLPDIELTEEQKDSILEAWNKGTQDLKPLIELAFGCGFDGRSRQGAAVKKFLATRKLKAVAAHEKIKRITRHVVLSEKQEEFVIKNAPNMRILELVRVLFKNNLLLHTSDEYKSVAEFVAENDISCIDFNKHSIKDVATKYKPPKNFEQAMNRVSGYRYNAFPSDRKVTQHQKNGLEALIRFCHTPRFLAEMDSLTKNSDRELFESNFVLFTYDKPDLSEEEVNLYINLCLDIVQERKIRMQIDQLRAFLMQCANDTEGRKMSQALADSVHQAEQEFHQNRQRQDSLTKTLQGRRAERLDKTKNAYASLLNLVAIWKDEKQRNEMIKYAEMEKNELAEETDRISSLDDLRARIMGISKEELLNGKM